jgi:hypothetical protein
MEKYLKRDVSSRARLEVDGSPAREIPFRSRRLLVPVAGQPQSAGNGAAIVVLLRAFSFKDKKTGKESLRLLCPAASDGSKPYFCFFPCFVPMGPGPLPQSMQGVTRESLFISVLVS